MQMVLTKKKEKNVHFVAKLSKMGDRLYILVPKEFRKKAEKMYVSKEYLDVDINPQTDINNNDNDFEGKKSSRK